MSALAGRSVLEIGPSKGRSRRLRLERLQTTLQALPQPATFHVQLYAARGWNHLVFAIGTGLRITRSECYPQDATLWVDEGIASTAFDLSLTDAQRIAKWAGIPVPEPRSVNAALEAVQRAKNEAVLVRRPMCHEELDAIGAFDHLGSRA